MSRKLLWSVGIFLLVLIVSILIMTWPREETGCVNDDGFCPQGCNFETDSDCASAEKIASIDTYRFCTKDIDCIAVRPLCGNTECPPTARNCDAGCFCAIGVKKADEALWQKEMVCKGETKCDKPCLPVENYSVACVSSLCKVLEG